MKSEDGYMKSEMAFPSLVLGKANGKDLRIVTAKKDIIIFESSELFENIISITVSVFNLETLEYDDFEFDNLVIIEFNQKPFTYSYKVKLENIDVKKRDRYISLITQIHPYSIIKATKKSMKKLERGKEIKNCGNHFPLYQSNGKYEDYYNNLDEQVKAWFNFKNIDNSQFSSAVSNTELAFYINNFNLYKQFLKNNFKEAIELNLTKLNIENHGIFSKSVSRVYIGNEFCHNLFPNTAMLLKLMDKAKKENFDITIAFTYLVERYVEGAKNLLGQLSNWCTVNNKEIEIIINDWGMLELLRKENSPFMKPILGRLMNKRKKDPRIDCWWGKRNYGIQLQQNNLNSDHFIKFLNEYGIKRFEFEAFLNKNVIPKGSHSLHFPFYQTNSSAFCKLFALCKRSSGKNMSLAVTCPKYCSEFVFLYPKKLNMIGKGNSVFGFDNSIFVNVEVLKEYIDSGIDRLVFSPD